MNDKELATSNSRLLQLADHLLNGKLGHATFDFAYYNLDKSGFNSGPTNICRTNGCAIGEMPIIWPRRFKFWSNGVIPYREGMPTTREFLGLVNQDYEVLFMPRSIPTHEGFGLPSWATKEEVAEQIKKFVQLRMEQRAKEQGQAHSPQAEFPPLGE